ncbi:UNVERIFIED_CONTAM: Glutamate receptor 2.9 [Sesamum radiatum]|uniref:Glutamate receptor 2.9 n=1 Tax=Sesamum radiatum TaxID=300843 RepID=A0AAW2MJ75_SESRA
MIILERWDRTAFQWPSHFYARNAHYKTRLQIHSRDSNGDVVGAAAAESMLGVIGVKPYISRTKEFDSFTVRYKKRLHQNKPTAISPDLNIYGLWAYDSAIALAMAAEKARLTNASYQKTDISTNSTDLEAFGVSRTGMKLIQVLSSTSFRGLAGKFLLVDGQLQSPPYDCERGPILDLSYGQAIRHLHQGLGYSHGKKLRIGVPINDGFTEFVRVTWNPDNSVEVEGYCIDVFDAVMAALPYAVSYEYIPFATPEHKYAGTNNDLAYQVYLGNYDAVAGDVTIVANRSQFVDFTLPFTASGVLMVVPVKDYKSKNAWAFLKPLTWQLWLTSFCSFVFMGFLIWILEHRVNEDFRGPPGPQLEEKVVSNLARFVLVIWFLVVLILTQSYTASLASMLTVQQLQPTVTDVNELIRNKEYVGYQEGSFVYGLPIGSPLVPDVSRAILNITEGSLHDHWHVIVDSCPDSTILSKIKELLRRFDNRDLSAHTFRKDRNGGDGEAVERAMESHENIQQRPSIFSVASSPTNSPASVVFSDYSEQNISFRREQGSSVETVIRNSQGEASQVTAES